MRILIVSAEVWKDGTNGGNVLSNIFEGIDAEFAQIYRNSGIPENTLCKRYFQMTDSMAIKNILRREKIGREQIYEMYPTSNEKKNELAEVKNIRGYSFFRKHNYPIFYAAKAILWKLANWKSVELENFIKDFSPDIIFAPCYGGCHMQALDRYVQDVAKVPMISYVSDDNYSLRQLSLAPSFWINRFLVRRSTRKTFKRYRLVYTMTQEQKRELERELGAEMKILCKGFDTSQIPIKQTIHRPIRIIYAGGLYLNRWKVLASVAKVIKRINENGERIRLDIYTGNELNAKQKRDLIIEGASYVHPAVPFSELMKIYNSSDLALHVESFDLKNRLSTRLSFSTKIVDCLSSGCAVMAIAWKEQAGFKYLRDNDAAICIDDKREIEKKLLEIYNHPEILIDYQEKARECCIKYHEKQVNDEMLRLDFERIINEGYSN